MHEFMFLLESTGTTDSNPFGGGMLMIVMFVVMVGFMFFSARSQKKQQQEEQNMRNGLAVGDEVTTIGGIIGKVISIKDETFVLETTKDKTKIRFLKAAVRVIDVKASDIAASVLETQSNSVVTNSAIDRVLRHAEEPVVEEQVATEDSPESEVQE